MNNENLVENSKQSSTRFPLSRGIRFMIFVIFWFIQLFNCSDGGVVSSSSNKIKQDLGFNDRQFGQYGSIVQLGRISGTFIVMILLNTLNRKFLMVFAICLKCSSFLFYFLTFNPWIVVAFRYLQGVSHVFPYVYFPTWCDQFGIQKYKTIMLSAMQTASPFGSVFGFSVTTFIGNWMWGFATLAFCILPLNLILAFIPDKYFSGKVYFFKTVEGGESAQQSEPKKSIYSLFEQTDTIRSKSGKGGSSSGSIWLSLLDGVFLFISLSRTVIMFIFMAIHYWLGDYYANVLGVTDKAQKAATYSFISLAGPSLGSMMGGTLCQWYAGGYDKKKAIFVCLFFSLLTSISALFVAEVTTLYSFAVVLFCFFTFANGMMPILIGISFNCVPPALRGSAYSVNSLLCTFLGNLPAPTIYGFLNDRFKHKDNRFAMRCIVNYIWVNFILLVLTAIFRYRKSEEGRHSKSDRPSKVKDIGAGMEASTGENPPPAGEKAGNDDEEKGTELQNK